MASVNLLSAMASSPARPRPVKWALWPKAQEGHSRNRTEPKGVLRSGMAAASAGGGAVVRRGWLAALHLGALHTAPPPVAARRNCGRGRL